MPRLRAAVLPRRPTRTHRTRRHNGRARVSGIRDRSTRKPTAMLTPSAGECATADQLRGSPDPQDPVVAAQVPAPVVDVHRLDLLEPEISAQRVRWPVRGARERVDVAPSTILPSPLDQQAQAGAREALALVVRQDHPPGLGDGLAGPLGRPHDDRPERGGPRLGHQLEEPVPGLHALDSAAVGVTRVRLGLRAAQLGHDARIGLESDGQPRVVVGAGHELHGRSRALRQTARAASRIGAGRDGRAPTAATASRTCSVSPGTSSWRMRRRSATAPWSTNRSAGMPRMRTVVWRSEASVSRASSMASRTALPNPPETTLSSNVTTSRLPRAWSRISCRSSGFTKRALTTPIDQPSSTSASATSTARMVIGPKPTNSRSPPSRSTSPWPTGISFGANAGSPNPGSRG